MKLANENHIVMVDDNPGDVFFVEQCLRSSRVPNPWLAFTNGQDFLAHLQRVVEGAAPMPALVLMDLNMPRMNGLEVIRATRAKPAFDDLPMICVLTSSTDPRDRERALAAGATDVWTKSGSIDDYVKLLESCL